MTLEKKTCQLATLYGWKRVLKDSLPTPQWRDAIWKDGIANIDEHLNGFISWTIRNKSDLVTDIRRHIWGMNSIIIYVRDLVKEGRLPMKVVDSRVKDVLRVKFKIGLFDHPYVDDAQASAQLVNCDSHKAVALEASKESIVLLKNRNSILPLSKELHTVAVICPNAVNDDYSHSHYGPLMSKSVNVLEGLQNKLGKQRVFFAKGCELIDKRWSESEILPEPPDNVEQAMIDSAVTVASHSEVAIVVLGGNTKTSGENKSRTSLDLPGHQLALVKAVKQTGCKVVVVLIGSQPMTVNWIDKYIDGIVYAGFPGVQGGTAVADVLFGDYNPGGKLTLTFPKSIGQIPYNFPSKPNAQTDEGESARVKGFLYPFGFGLSYTTFAYSNLNIEQGIKTKPDNHQYEGKTLISVDVTNTGKVAGDEVVQLYIRDVLSTVTTYEKQLRGFERVHLQPGETKTIKFILVPDDLKLWNRKMQHVVEPGVFNVMLGTSSENILLRGSFNIL